MYCASLILVLLYFVGDTRTQRTGVFLIYIEKYKIIEEMLTLIMINILLECYLRSAGGSLLGL
jgi:hypothetical protein